ncbi:MAG TPA: L-threonylcarbamoyladenylate synthase [Chitinophagaceae bacterium]|nr:L-threonylcarbamoyladenylate synthase [Chitinophagaceae bacterium]
MLDFQNDIDKCIETLNGGGIVLYPTDTVWGIGCDATNEKAVGKIYQLKNRPDEKSMLILLAGEKDVLDYVADPGPEVFEYLGKLTRPATMIYKGARNLAKNLIGRDRSIGIRICKDDFCQQLIRTFGKPIVSTSANISGEPAAKTFNEISEDIKKGVDYIVQYRQEETHPREPSMIIQWKNKKAIVIRP